MINVPIANSISKMVSNINPFSEKLANVPKPATVPIANSISKMVSNINPFSEKPASVPKPSKSNSFTKKLNASVKKDSILP